MNWGTVLDGVGLYFATAAAYNWQRNFTGPMGALMSERITDLNQTYSQRLPPVELLQGDWFNEYTITFAQPINATTEESVRRLIEQATTEGWSIPTTQKHLTQLFEQWMTGKLTPEEFEWFSSRMPEHRTELIARDQTMRSLNTVSYRLYGAWGVESHTWEATGDRRTRPAHAAAHGQTVKVGFQFQVGGEGLLYPGDPRGSLGNIIQCRCVTIPEI